MTRFCKAFAAILLPLWLLAGTGVAHAAIDVYNFHTTQQQQRFHKLTEQLRCPKCQDESIASSNAEIASDMRHQVATMILQGKSDKQIMQYFIDRYGDFVTYKPPFNAHTAILWLGPGLMLAGGLGLVLVLIRRASRRADDEPADGGGEH